MATQKKVAQSRAQVTVQQSSPGKAEVSPIRSTGGPAILEVQERQLTPAERKELLRQELVKVKNAIRLTEEELTPKFTLEDAFDYDPSNEKEDVVKGILAVSFLLDSVSEIGNESIDGQTAQGLASALRHYADCANKYLVEADRVHFLEWQLEQVKKQGKES